MIANLRACVETYLTGRSEVQEPSGQPCPGLS